MLPAACGELRQERGQSWHGHWHVARQSQRARRNLRVQVPDAGWRAELQALAPQYLAVINRYVAESVKKVEFVVKEKDFAGKGARAFRQTLPLQK